MQHWKAKFPNGLVSKLLLRCRSAVREAFQKHGRERLVTFDKSSKNSFVNGNSGEEVKGGDLKRHIVTVGHHKTSTASYSSRPTPTPYFYRVRKEFGHFLHLYIEKG